MRFNCGREALKSQDAATASNYGSPTVKMNHLREACRELARRILQLPKCNSGMHPFPMPHARSFSVLPEERIRRRRSQR